MNRNPSSERSFDPNKMFSSKIKIKKKTMSKASSIILKKDTTLEEFDKAPVKRKLDFRQLNMEFQNGIASSSKDKYKPTSEQLPRSIKKIKILQQLPSSISNAVKDPNESLEHGSESPLISSINHQLENLNLNTDKALSPQLVTHMTFPASMSATRNVPGADGKTTG